MNPAIEIQSQQTILTTYIYNCRVDGLLLSEKQKLLGFFHYTLNINPEVVNHSWHFLAWIRFPVYKVSMRCPTDCLTLNYETPPTQHYGQKCLQFTLQTRGHEIKNSYV